MTTVEGMDLPCQFDEVRLIGVGAACRKRWHILTVERWG
jgi:hypothetical protein